HELQRVVHVHPDDPRVVLRPDRRRAGPDELDVAGHAVLEVTGRVAGVREWAITDEAGRDRTRLAAGDVRDLGSAFLVGERVLQRADHELMDRLPDIVDLEGHRLAL